VFLALYIERRTPLKVMGKRVSKCLREERIQQIGKLDQCETPHGNHVDRVTLLPIGVRTNLTHMVCDSEIQDVVVDTKSSIWCWIIRTTCDDDVEVGAVMHGFEEWLNTHLSYYLGSR
jgi:hypothetical protein